MTNNQASYEFAGEASLPNPNDSSMLLSIVVVCLNDAEALRDTLESLLPCVSMRASSVEVVVVDGGSEDGTCELLTKVELRYPGCISWKSERDRGIYDAMNKGIERSRGLQVAFLNAGDRYENNAIESLLDARAPEMILYGDTLLCDDAGLVVQRVNARPEVLGQRFPAALVANHQSMAFPRATLLALKGFDTRWTIAADYELFCRCLSYGCGFQRIDGVIARFLLGGVSSIDPVRTAREYREIKIARGCSKLAAQVGYLKNRISIVLRGVAA